MPLPVPAPQWPVKARLARRLLHEQHPDLAGLPLRRIGSGWDTVVFRLGRDLTVRLPRRELGSELLRTELRWLPGLAPRLPLPVPEPVRAGVPGATFPHPWSVCRYVPGRTVGADGLPAGPAAPLRTGESVRSAGTGSAAASPPEQLAAFLQALHVPAPADAPVNAYRGVALAERDESVRAALGRVPEPQRQPLTRLWDAALDGWPAHAGPALWLHGDLHGLNLLRSRDRISGVIDFGDLCAGDPATDLAVAWLVLDEPGRRRLRDAYAGPPDRWARGAGWAVLMAVMFLAHSEADRRNAAIGSRALAQLAGPG